MSNLESGVPACETLALGIIAACQAEKPDGAFIYRQLWLWNVFYPPAPFELDPNVKVGVSAVWLKSPDGRRIELPLSPIHQGLGNKLIVPMERPPDTNANIETTERLGGLLRSYRRAA